MIKRTKSIREIKEEILASNQKTLFELYTGKKLRYGKAIKSPLREEKHPSFNIYLSNGKVLFKDFNGEGGDIFEFVSQLYGIDFINSVKMIARDMHSGNFDIDDVVINISKRVKPKKGEKQIDYGTKPYSKSDLLYMAQYGIGKKTLKKYNTSMCAWFEIYNYDKKLIVAAEYSSTNPIYIYEDIKKFYRPLHNKKFGKWFASTGQEPFGIKQWRKSTQDFTLLLAGEKDVMSMYANTGICGIALGSEGCNIPPTIHLELLERGKIISIYDQDATGIKMAKEFEDSYQIKAARLETLASVYSWWKPKGDGYSDVSDFFKHFMANEETTSMSYIITNLIQNL